MNKTIKPIIFDLDDVRRKAEKGNKCACYILGRSYDSEENGAKQSFEKVMHQFGFGNVERDENKAFELIHDCVMQGHLPAIYDLVANFYYNGVGTEKNLIFKKGQ